MSANFKYFFVCVIPIICRYLVQVRWYETKEISWSGQTDTSVGFIKFKENQCSKHLQYSETWGMQMVRTTAHKYKLGKTKCESGCGQNTNKDWKSSRQCWGIIWKGLGVI